MGINICEWDIPGAEYPQACFPTQSAPGAKSGHPVAGHGRDRFRDWIVVAMGLASEPRPVMARGGSGRVVKPSRRYGFGAASAGAGAVGTMMNSLILAGTKYSFARAVSSAVVMLSVSL